MDIKTLFTLSCIALLYTVSACNSIDSLNPNENNQSTLEEAADQPYYVRKDGALSFNSIEAYKNLSDSLTHLSDQEFQEWEIRIGFKSYRSIINEALIKIDKATNKKEYNSILKQYADYIYLGKDSLIYSKIECQFYKNIINSAGIFYVLGTQNKVDEKNISAFENGEKVATYSLYTIPLTKTEEVLDAFPTYETTWDGRRVITRARFYKLTTTGGGIVIENTMLEIYVQGFIKTIFNTYKSYGTVLMLDDIIFRIKSASGNIFENTWPDQETEDNTASLTAYIPATFGNELICLHYRARSRGTGNKGVGYNVYNHQWYDSAGVNKCDAHPAVSPIKPE